MFAGEAEISSMDQLLLERFAVMTQDEKQFFRALGARVAELRKEQGITQQQLAELLGVSQQSVAAYEVGRLRIAVSMLPRLAKNLGVSVEALIGEEIQPAARRGPTPKLAQQMERISRLPRTKQRFVMDVIESVLAQAAREGARS
jgi:transcriptional regulator with XRE-family HTH domain